MSLNMLSSMVRSVSRITPIYTRSAVFSKPTTRSLWNLVQPSSTILSKPLLTNVNLTHWSPTCSGPLCGACGVHTTADKELIEFLTEEIAGEKRDGKRNAVPMKVNDFNIETNGSEMTFSKKLGEEVVKVSLNVNLSVDADQPELEASQDSDKPQTLNSKPPFDVMLIKGSQTMKFRCNFVLDQEQEQPSDFFYIDDVTIHEGELKDETYTVAADILDEYMYDLLMNVLEEKGMSNAFAEKLSDIATDYEHELYVKFLENMKSFVHGK